MKKKLAVLLAVFTTMSVMTVPQAEASVINTSLSRVLEKFRSRNFQQRNGSAVIQAGLVGCKFGYPMMKSHLNLELKEDLRWHPDRKAGIRNAKNCLKAPTRVSWGKQGRGNYYIQVGLQHAQDLSAKKFNIYYGG